MKLLLGLLCGYLAVVGAARAADDGRSLVTFDGFEPGADSIIIPASYHGLQWYNFSVLNGSLRPQTEGYHRAVVSPDNVAFNSYGDPAMIWTLTRSFDLHSAYLTAAHFNGLQVRVQGFSGPRFAAGTNGPVPIERTIAYDNTYVLNPDAPTLIQFDFRDVDQVRFTTYPPVQFAMDNVEVTVHDVPATHVPLHLPPVQVRTIGHFFQLDDTPFGGSLPQNVVFDALIHQEQSWGGGGVLESVSVDWNTKDQFVLTIAAPLGMKFLVRPPPGRPAQFGGMLWWESTRGGLSFPGLVSVSFTGLEGTPPDFAGSDSVLSDSHGFFGVADIDSTPFTNALAFTSMTITGTVVAQHTDFGTQTFAPHLGSQLLLAYTTPETNDPGRFVSVVPENPPPRIRVLTISNEGTELFVQGQAGWTTIVERSPDLVHWTPISTNVMPFSLCPICPFVIVKDTIGKNLPRHFYRAFEIP